MGECKTEGQGLSKDGSENERTAVEALNVEIMTWVRRNEERGVNHFFLNECVAFLFVSSICSTV